MPLSPYAFITSDGSQNERQRVHEGQLNQSTVEKIEAVLAQMGMSAQDLVELLSALLGKGAGEVTLDEAKVILSDEDGRRALDDVYSDEELLALLDQLEVIQRLRILQLSAHGIEISELEALIDASGEKKLDRVTLQVLSHQRAKRMLNPSELSKVRKTLTGAEYGLVISETLNGSGNAEVQARALGQLSQQFLPPNQRFDLAGRGQQLVIRQQDTAKQETGKTQTRLCRLDYRMDMKRLAESARSLVSKLTREMRAAGKKAEKRDITEDEKALKPESLEAVPDTERMSLNRDTARKETDKDQKKLTILDHAKDIQAAMKAAQSRLKKMFSGNKVDKTAEDDKDGAKTGSFEQAKDRKGWEKEGEQRELAMEEKQQRLLDGKEILPHAGVMTVEKAQEHTAVDQHKLQKLDALADRLRDQRQHMNHAPVESRHASAHAAMAKAEAGIGTLGSRQAVEARAAELAGAMSGLGKLADASLDQVGEGLDKVKDFKKEHPGKQIGS